MKYLSLCLLFLSLATCSATGLTLEEFFQKYMLNSSLQSDTQGPYVTIKRFDFSSDAALAEVNSMGVHHCQDLAIFATVVAMIVSSGEEQHNFLQYRTEWGGVPTTYKSCDGVWVLESEMPTYELTFEALTELQKAVRQ